MAGYLPPDANADAFVDGWYRTGDIGWLEPEGWIHITDRFKEMIKVRGFQVAPAEIEAVLLSLPGIADCAVFGVDDAQLGEAVVAAVQVRDGQPSPRPNSRTRYARPSLRTSNSAMWCSSTRFPVCLRARFSGGR
jgi:acyl-CoA synthetase (AMP-forming)/AMP-acid ligase II